MGNVKKNATVGYPKVWHELDQDLLCVSGVGGSTFTEPRHGFPASEEDVRMREEQT